MNAGYGGGLPDYHGGSGGGSADEGRGGGSSSSGDFAPHSQAGPSSQDPYAVGDGGADPYGADPYATDPYAADPYAADPYATDPLNADGFGPVFGSSAPAQSGGYAVTAYESSQPYGAHPSGPPGYGSYPPPLPSSGAGITGFVLGLLSLTLCAGLTAPVGIFFAAQGMKETGPHATHRKGGRGLAIAGLVTSLVGMVPFLFMVLYIALFVVAIIAGATSSA